MVEYIYQCSVNGTDKEHIRLFFSKCWASRKQMGRPPMMGVTLCLYIVHQKW